MRFVFLRAEFCRQLPSDSTSRWTPLLLANGWRLQTPIVDFHHQVGCHARHTKKRPAITYGRPHRHCGFLSQIACSVKWPFRSPPFYSQVSLSSGTPCRPTCLPLPADSGSRYPQARNQPEACAGAVDCISLPHHGAAYVPAHPLPAAQ
jgi:hypothetical protein